MSLDNLNETTKNLLIALSENIEKQPAPVIIKLTYNSVTGLVDGFTMEETDKPWIEISREQYNAGFQCKKLKVVNGKLEEIKRSTTKELLLVEGNRWFTTKENMLIIGNERGWDERGNT
jgi:hypothetical protein